MQDLKQWFKQAGYGMMVHWGLYSLLGGEWKDKKCGTYSEWIQAHCNIPISEYEKLAKAFNPVFFDAGEWIKFAKECGMKYFVVTAKHHDGFAMFKSRVDKYNIVDATPFGRDVVAELGEACYKYGLKMGLYYSQDLDWHEKNGGGYLSGHIPCEGTAWCNNWDFPEDNKKNFSQCFEDKIYPQVEELLKNYGELLLMWFDVPMTLSEAQSKKLYDAVKRYQPQCLINSRLGNGAYDYVSLGDNEIPDKIPENLTLEKVMMNDIDGFKPSPYGLYETAATINHTWGYSAWDHDWKTAEKIVENKRKLNAMGINYLLNVGPDGLGRIPLESREVLRRAAELEK